MDSLLEQFLADEAVPYVRKLIADAIAEHRARPMEVQRRFEFNRFEVTLDYANARVVIEDILTPEASGETQLSMVDFLCLLADRHVA